MTTRHRRYLEAAGVLLVGAIVPYAVVSAAMHHPATGLAITVVSLLASITLLIWVFFKS